MKKILLIIGAIEIIALLGIIRFAILHKKPLPPDDEKDKIVFVYVSPEETLKKELPEVSLPENHTNSKENLNITEVEAQDLLTDIERQWTVDPLKKGKQLTTGPGRFLPCWHTQISAGKFPEYSFTHLNYYFAEKIGENTYKLRACITLLEPNEIFKIYHMLKAKFVLPHFYDDEVREAKPIGHFISGGEEIALPHPQPNKPLRMEAVIYLPLSKPDTLFLDVDLTYYCNSHPCNTYVLSQRRQLPHEAKVRCLPDLSPFQKGQTKSN